MKFLQYKNCCKFPEKDQVFRKGQNESVLQVVHDKRHARVLVCKHVDAQKDTPDKDK